MFDTKPNSDNTLLSRITLALEEDLGGGDVTSEAIFQPDQLTSGYMIAKQDGVVAGLEVAAETFRLKDERILFTPEVEDGEKVKDRTIIARFSGPVVSLLGSERVALNFMQRMSGIATLTRRFVDEVEGTGAVILDTRKTVPGLRYLDKLAVRLGGGQNHRMGLYDMAMLKENHIRAAGGITPAVQQVRAANPNIPIEVEVTNLAELHEALPLDVARIMLDNMSLDEMREAVAITNGRTPLEASGNVRLETVRGIAETGVDYISSGALTHSVKAMDISMLFDR